MATIYKRRRGVVLTDYGPAGVKEVPVYTRDLFGVELEACSFCGEPRAAAFWQGVVGSVSVCGGGAVGVLPCLMADALTGERGETPGVTTRLQEGLQRALTNFWRAATLAVARGAKLAAEEARR